MPDTSSDKTILQPYTLADAAMLADKETSYRFLVWRPDHICVVIGRSNTAQTAVYLPSAMSDGAVVYQRRTGGQSVVLTPDMLVVSILQNGPTKLNSKKYFRAYNQRIVDALQGMGIHQLEQKGISDIVLNGRKIAGTAIYRNPRQVFYHAVLNVAGTTELMERYLTFPEKVPDYRAGRSHQEFVTSLYAEGFTVDFEKLRAALIGELTVPPQIT